MVVRKTTTNLRGNIRFIYAAVLAGVVSTVDARVWLEVPRVANCRGDTVLTCHYCDTPLTNWTWSRKYGDVWRTFMVNGTQIDSWPKSVIREEFNGWFSLIIHGADNMAHGSYRCGVGEYQSDETYLQVECKPERAEVRLTQDKHIEIKLNTVFPIPKINFTLTDGAPKDTSISFQNPHCRGISWIQDCTWISTTALGNGLYSYMLTATTVTETTFYGNIY